MSHGRARARPCGISAGILRSVIPAFINPHAGNAADARAALERTGAFEIRDAAPGALAGAVQSATAAGARRVLVAGGDGTIGTAAAALARSAVELAILPCGTLNHLARDLALPTDLDAAARVAAGNAVVTVDAATVNGRLFLNTSSVGAYAMFVRARERLEHRVGYHVASFVAGVRLLWRLPVFRISLEVEGVARQYATPLVFVGVGERELRLPTLGARVSGGRSGLHVMVVRRRTGARAIALGLAAAARGVDAVANTPALDAFIVDRCRIEPRTHTAALDGELVTVDPPLEYRHVPGCLRVVVPS